MIVFMIYYDHKTGSLMFWLLVQFWMYETKSKIEMWNLYNLADHGHTGLCFPGTEVRIKDFNSD